MTEERFDGRTVSYEYDDVGNRLKRVDSAEGTTTYVYDENDRLLESTANGVLTTYEYDDNGNLTSQTTNGKETTYTWDDRNRLVEVQTDDGDTVVYEYDDENIRVSSTVNGTKTTYLVDSNRPYAQVLEEYEDDNLKVRYVHGLDLISVERDGEVSVYLVDGLGSTRTLTDLNGEVVATYTYDAFGELLNSTGKVENDYLFAGEQFDGELEQYYLRQRFYDAGVGRFTRRDSYEGRIGEPITLHKYLYGNANPVNLGASHFRKYTSSAICQYLPQGLLEGDLLL
ncbi:Rhs-family protein [Geitlerinema sp. FC II]|nr:Rhs-family protein [Geitlerinema sp. FC II]